MWVYLLLVSWRSKEKYTLFSFLPKKRIYTKEVTLPDDDGTSAELFLAHSVLLS